jgi:4'-phosphopantetheinyl transferase
MGSDTTKSTLPDLHAHLWWIRPDLITDPDQLDRCRAILTDDEQAKIDRFRFSRDQQLCLLARVLLRTALSNYAVVPPKQWRFRINAYGRPEIAAPASPLRFNLSHTNGMIVCLVSRAREVGVDVECLERVSRWVDLADRYFAPREAAALRREPPDGRPIRFLEYWTLKEAYLKARGLGLAIPLTDFSFELPVRAVDDVEIRFSPSLDDDTERWQFSLRRIGQDHLVATAIERHGEPIRITLLEETDLLY